MVIVFDLDDTLYDDRTFVLSGFKAVAQKMSPILGMGRDLIEVELEKELNVNRNQVFDRFLEKHGYYTKGLVRQFLSIYRSHIPHIHLFPEAEACLNRLQKYPLYVLTDGNKNVQKNKFLALGLETRIKKCLCTNAYGRKHAKPSPYCFMKICEWEKTNPSCVIYVADNPRKDFVGIKPLGFHTIRILTGPHHSLSVPLEFDADVKLPNLSYLDEQLLSNLF